MNSVNKIWALSLVLILSSQAIFAGAGLRAQRELQGSGATGSVTGSGSGWEDACCPEPVCPEPSCNCPTLTCNCPEIDYSQLTCSATDCNCATIDYAQIASAIDYTQLTCPEPVCPRANCNCPEESEASADAKHLAGAQGGFWGFGAGVVLNLICLSVIGVDVSNAETTASNIKALKWTNAIFSILYGAVMLGIHMNNG